MNQRLLNFYRGKDLDAAGRSLSTILEQDDDWWELTHDFVQWLFPLDEPSRHSPNAPLLDAGTIAAFQADAQAMANLQLALTRFMAFLGLDLLPGDGYAKRATWNRSKRRWFTRDTHNSLRITRAMKSLILLGQPDWAEHVHRTLRDLCVNERGCDLSTMTRSHWRAVFADLDD